MVRVTSLLSASIVSALAVSSAQATVIFSDDFESYATGDPAVMTKWSHNGNGAAPNASRIYDTSVNFGGTRLWIAESADARAGTGLDSIGIDVASDTEYLFSGAFVTETNQGSRTATGTVDLLLGTSLGTATSIIGGPQAFTARGDDADASVPNVNTSNSYEDQLTTVAFTTGQVNAGEQLFISIAFDGADATNPFVGIDDVTLTQVPEPGSLALMGLGGLLIARRRRS